MLDILVRALVIGFLVAAPVGAMALLAIERTLAGGRSRGYATGAGIASADALYASIAAFGLTALTSALTGAQGFVRIVGGAFLIYLGVRAMLSRPRDPGAPSVAASTFGSYASALGLTLANPQTILTFVGVFAGAGLVVTGQGWFAPLVTIAGVFAGSLAWWIALVTVVALVRDRLSGSALLWITRVSGAALAVFGLFATVSGALALAS